MHVPHESYVRSGGSVGGFLLVAQSLCTFCWFLQLSRPGCRPAGRGKRAPELVSGFLTDHLRELAGLHSGHLLLELPADLDEAGKAYTLLLWETARAQYQYGLALKLAHLRQLPHSLCAEPS